MTPGFKLSSMFTVEMYMDLCSVLVVFDKLLTFRRHNLYIQYIYGTVSEKIILRIYKYKVIKMPRV